MDIFIFMGVQDTKGEIFSNGTYQILGCEFLISYIHLDLFVQLLLNGMLLHSIYKIFKYLAIISEPWH